jgi:hypothetical protein
MISGAQMKAARMLLNWDVSTLARSASVEEARIRALEAASDEPTSDAHEARTLIQKTLEAAGVKFPDTETVTLKQVP